MEEKRKIMKIFFRIIASPFLLGLILIRYNTVALMHLCLFLRYGGEWITYSKKDELITVQNLYNELKKDKDEAEL